MYRNRMPGQVVLSEEVFETSLDRILGSLVGGNAAHSCGIVTR